MTTIGSILLVIALVDPILLGDPQEVRASPKRPVPLEEMVRSRESIRTAELDLVITDYKQAEKRMRTVSPRYKSALIADDRFVLIDRGDIEGVTVRTTDGTPGITGRTPQLAYSESGTIITCADGMPLQGAMLRKGADVPTPDFRTLGVGSGPPFADLHSTVWQPREPNPELAGFEVSNSEKMVVVRCKSGEHITTYWLDPQRGWNPIRVRTEQKDQRWSESRSELAESDGIWFPNETSFFSSTFHDGQKPTQVVQITTASFNAPGHAQELSPASIGLEPGMDVTVTERGKPSISGKWSGSEVISFHEYAERAARGEVRDGPRLSAAFVRHVTGDAANDRAAGATPVRTVSRRSEDVAVSVDRAAPTTQVASSQDSASGDTRWAMWEQFVRDFVAEYELDADQQQKAVMLLLRCEVKGDSFLASKADALEKLEAERLDPAKKAEADEKLAKLLAPIDDIFEKNLKPGLEKLPTRAQRAAVEKRKAEKADK